MFVMEEYVEKLKRAFQDPTFERFDEKIVEQAEYLEEQVRKGELENEGFTVGLELETYATDKEGDIEPIPASVFESDAVNPELGLQNIEINAEARRCTEEGVKSLREELKGKMEEARSELRKEGMRLQLDSVWTQHSSPEEYLTERKERGGFVFPENMKSATRYHGLDNAILRKTGEIGFEVPGVSRSFPSILFECLATSIQPHLQIPDTEKFPVYYSYAIRSMAPVLALTSNSPFLPAELYGDVKDPEKVVEESMHELRIPIFEQAVNTSEDYFGKKCRVPEDIESLEEAVWQIKEDEIYYPWLKEWDEPEEGFKDEFWELEYKTGTFWRWVRPVFGGQEVEDACGEKSARIEYRPVPTQPTLKDILSVQALVVGLLRGLVEEEHPVKEQDWGTAKRNFYRVAENGLSAEIEWIDRDGREAGKETALEETIRHAEKGLESFGFSEEKISELLHPIKERRSKEMTPSRWKKQKVSEALANGKNFNEALEEMQQEYYRKSSETGSFAEWI
jgi:gamma-glutamyl:cysteine ligase YbdK (ATP-grasp superfamily)